LPRYVVVKRRLKGHASMKSIRPKSSYMNLSRNGKIEIRITLSDKYWQCGVMPMRYPEPFPFGAPERLSTIN
jgi:hypothetical protein